ncbi:MAG: branched-chain amino acid ABC transporter permease [Rhodocyclales bacterium]|nr:branched-chain amino acid ABC transporter permease [Rhodocyclales bacterium]
MKDWIKWLPLIAALAAVPWLTNAYMVSLLLTCLMYVALAVSWVMFSGPSRYLSLATTAFFGIGAYCTAWGLGHLPWPLLLLGGALAAAGTAALVGLFVLKLRGSYFAVLTFGLSELALHVINQTERSISGTVGRVLLNPPEQDAIYLAVLALALAAIACCAWLWRGPLGHALRGIGADEDRAATLGVNPLRVKLAGFALAAAFAGAVGAAMAGRWTYIDPHTVFNPLIGFQTVLIVMVGGASRIQGAVIGAVIFSLLSEFLRMRFPYFYLVLLGLLLILSVLYLPNGLIALLPRKKAAAHG